MMFDPFSFLDHCCATVDLQSWLSLASQFNDNIANDPKWREIKEAFRQSNPSDTPLPMHWIALFGAMLVGLFLINWMHGFFQRRALARRHLVSFELLATDLGLAWSDRRLLIHIAQQQQLPSPLTLMLSDPTLAHHGNLYIQQLQPYRQQAALDRMNRIRNRLFGPIRSESNATATFDPIDLSQGNQQNDSERAGTSTSRETSDSTKSQNTTIPFSQHATVDASQ